MVNAQVNPGGIRLAQEALAVSWSQGDSLFRLSHDGQAFMEFAVGADAWRQRPQAQPADAALPLPDGKAILVQSSAVIQVAIFPGVPFVLLHLAPATAAPPEGGGTWSARLRLPVPADRLGALLSDGAQPVGDGASLTADAVLAVADATERGGIVAGFVTFDRFLGTVCVERHGDRIDLKAVVAPEPDAEPRPHDGEWLAIGRFADVLDGLEAYAELVATVNGAAPFAVAPSGHCTWYYDRASNQHDLAALARFARKELQPYGLSVIQIDDGWQASGRDYTRESPAGPYPAGMKATVQDLGAQGFSPGVWLIPFGWDPQAPSLRDHPRWFVQDDQGQPMLSAIGGWAGHCLDMSDPQARQFLQGVIRRLVHDDGFRYLKLDGLYAGIARGGRANKAMTRVQAYREGLRAIRAAAGPGVFLLGCNLAQSMEVLGPSFGLLDGMRIGTDVDATWENILPCAAATAHRYYLHRRAWHNDPDCLLVRERLTFEQARSWASLLALSGQMVITSDDLPSLPPERLALIRKTMPDPGTVGRPLDLMGSKIPSLWWARVERPFGSWHVVGLFNWSAQEEQTLSLDLGQIGPVGQTYLAYDPWESRFAGTVQGQLRAILPPCGCRVLALHRLCCRPQVIGTDRHVVVGAVDLQDLAWEPTGGVLHGVCRSAPGSRYRLTLHVPGGWQAVSSSLGELESNGTPHIVELAMDIPPSGRAAWKVQFARNEPQG